MDMAENPILGLHNISKITICRTFTLELRGWSRLHLLKPNFWKSTKLASYLCWSLPHYPFSHFQNTKFRKLAAQICWKSSMAAAGVVRSCSVGDENSFGLNSSRVDRPPSLVLVGLFWWSMMPGRPETTDLPLVLVAIPLSVAIKSAGYSSIQPSQQPGCWRRPDKGEKWGVLCAEATFEGALFAFFSPTCFTTDWEETTFSIYTFLSQHQIFV